MEKLLLVAVVTKLLNYGTSAQRRNFTPLQDTQMEFGVLPSVPMGRFWRVEVTKERSNFGMFAIGKKFIHDRMELPLV
jgi:hypothetical protein